MPPSMSCVLPTAAEPFSSNLFCEGLILPPSTAPSGGAVPNGRMLQRPGVASLCCSGAHSTSWLEIWQPAPFAEECWLFPEGNKEKALNEMILWSVYEGWTACTLPIILDKGRDAVNACAFILRYQNDDFSGIAKKWMLQRNAKEKMA